MRILMSSIFLVISVQLFGQGPPAENASLISKPINNALTELHENVLGTKVFMIPPDGFDKRYGLFGFRKDEYTILGVMEVANVNYFDFMNGFERKYLSSKKGFIIIESSSFLFNGKKANFYRARSNDDLFESMLMVIGDSSHVVMLNSSYLSDDEQSKSEIQKSMFSFIYDAELEIDYLKSSPISIDDKNSQFKFKSGMGSSLFYMPLDYDSIQHNALVTIAVEQSVAGISPKLISLKGMERLKQRTSDVLLIDSSFNKYREMKAYEGLYEVINNKEEICYALSFVFKNDEITVATFCICDDLQDIDEARKLLLTIEMK